MNVSPKTFFLGHHVAISYNSLPITFLPKENKFRIALSLDNAVRF